MGLTHIPENMLAMTPGKVQSELEGASANRAVSLAARLREEEIVLYPIIRGWGVDLKGRISNVYDQMVTDCLRFFSLMVYLSSDQVSCMYFTLGGNRAQE